MKRDTFEFTTTELAKQAGISRSYLYKKAKQIGLELDGIYTKQDIEKLKKSDNHKKSASNSVSSKTMRHSHETLEGDIFFELENTLKKQISDLKEQLTVKDEQLKTKDQQIQMANQLADQAQKLQADLQTRLDNKNQELLTFKQAKKSFWSKLFH
ncbi:hypothetical protein [Fructobacillus fructosus]|uniref:hypothetical protein n=1 Tax=Fructobacillus fructosus TaxID=1631 RepID=UPI00200A5444|nr:hypothetical protein [Fructobacillus fructosus]MCK8639111.1 hypothetical protein [Fructobacillus fructosus]